LEPAQKIEELEAKVKSLEEEMHYLQEDLEAADDEVEDLENQIKKLETADAIFLNKLEVVEHMKSILQKGLHNINITAPKITDIEKLNLYDVSSSVNLKVSCDIDPSIPEHQKLMDEMNSFDNISLRVYPGKDRWAMLKDGEVLFMAIVGEEKNHLLSFKTDDPKHIHVFNTLVMETWLRGRKKLRFFRFWKETLL
jgi:G3E family GTPase